MNQKKKNSTGQIEYIKKRQNQIQYDLSVATKTETSHVY